MPQRIVVLSLGLTVAAACLFSEFIGYWLHVLLHSEKIPILSRNHMTHHLVVYARSRKTKSSRAVLSAAYDGAARLFMGTECFFPVFAILSLALIAMRLLGLAVVIQAAFVGTSLVWGLIMFHHMHDAMHDDSSWMERSGFLRERFLRARRLHGIHHLDMDAAGRLTRNYGVFFFAFDRLFGTFAEKQRSSGHDGLRTAFKRYLDICSSAG